MGRRGVTAGTGGAGAAAGAARAGPAQLEGGARWQSMLTGIGVSCSLSSSQAGGSQCARRRAGRGAA